MAGDRAQGLQGQRDPAYAPAVLWCVALPDSRINQGGTGKRLRGAGSQLWLLGQQPKSLSRNVAGGVMGKGSLAVVL